MTLFGIMVAGGLLASGYYVHDGLLLNKLDFNVAKMLHIDTMIIRYSLAPGDRRCRHHHIGIVGAHECRAEQLAFARPDPSDGSNLTRVGWYGPYSTLGKRREKQCA